MAFTLVRQLILFINLCSVLTLSDQCPSGWFGSRCQYKCNCQGTCDDDGCQGPCEIGWFGFKCQYQDLLTSIKTWMTPTNAKISLTDNNISTCVEAGSILVDLGIAYPISWIRIQVSIIENLKFLNVDFQNYSYPIIKKNSEKKLVITGSTLDVFTKETVRFIELKGNIKIGVCSLYISRGQNVALKQSAAQTSTYDAVSNASNAVDGNVENDHVSGSCSHTADDRSSNWTLTLQTARLVNRIVIYNRNKQQNRLLSFKLEMINENNRITFIYQDTNKIGKEIYTIYTSSTIPSKQLIISIPGSFLTLCEVEVYSECSQGKWGLECDKLCDNCIGNCRPDDGNCDKLCIGDFERCDCKPGYWGDTCSKNCNTKCQQNHNNDVCNANTGQCKYGCNSPGYMPDLCQTNCKHGKYGLNCIHSCSENCLKNEHDESCDPINGYCTHGCKAGYNGTFCDADCKHGKYGLNCNNSCSVNCVKNEHDELCDPINGYCTHGCKAGYNGTFCDAACISGRYGGNCLQVCSKNCDGQRCDSKDGTCQDGCVEGFDGDYCDRECRDSLYGINCSKSCSIGCFNNTCHSTSGICFSCQEGFEGNYCEKEIDAGHGFIVGIIAAIIAALLVIMIVVLWRKQRKANKSQQDGCKKLFPISFFKRPETHRKGKYVEDDDEIELSLANNETFEADDQGTVTTSLSEPINVKDLKTYLSGCNKEFFIHQFKNVKEPYNVTNEAALKESNRPKNRYKNICPYDHSRVLLNINTDNNEDDYINASYIKNFKGEIKFIASQGPNKAMMDDFIRMLWEQKTNKLVMLTSVIETGKLKCEQYWPDKGSAKFGKIKVKLISEEKFAEYSMRKIELSKTDEQSHTVTQYHYQAWPDQNVPSSPWGLVDFYHLVSSSQSEKPIVVHCSAGVGRTGTFIGLFNLVEQARETGRVDFYKTLSDMRQDRMWMIQTPNQYEFLHKAVLVATACSGTFMEMNDVSARIYQLNQKTISGKTKLEDEFKTVSEICTYLNDQHQSLNAEESDEVVYENTKNTKKNRFSDIIPQDSCRPVLSCEPTSSGDYINAVIFKSFNQECQHILTQLPLAATLVDFWRLVTEFNVSLIVAFETDLAATDETIGEYLPSNEEQELMCPPFKIHSAYMKQTEVWEERKLTIIMNSTSHRVVHLKSKFVDLNSRQFLTFIKQSRSYELPSEKILYVCRNGALYSGLASVLTNLLDRFDHYLSCSVPLVVGIVKSLRPQVIPTLDQYNTVYDILNRYTETSCIYGNVSVNLPKKTDKK